MSTYGWNQRPWLRTSIFEPSDEEVSAMECIGYQWALTSVLETLFAGEHSRGQISSLYVLRLGWSRAPGLAGHRSNKIKKKTWWFKVTLLPCAHLSFRLTASDSARPLARWRTERQIRWYKPLEMLVMGVAFFFLSTIEYPQFISNHN